MVIRIFIFLLCLFYAGTAQAIILPSPTHQSDIVVKKPWVDPRAFGAVPDDGIDDSTAIQAAITAGAGTKVYFALKGTYNVTGDVLTVSNNTDIEGVAGVVLKMATTASTKKLLNVASSVTRSTISNLTLDINQGGAISNIAVNIAGAANVTIRGLKVINSAVVRAWPATGYGYGVYLNNSWANVKVLDSYMGDIMYAVITEPSSTGKNLTVSKGLIEYLSGDGVEINAPTGSAENIEVEGLTFYRLGSNSASRGFGVGMSGAAGSTVKSVDVHDNRFIECDFHGVHIEDGSQIVKVHHNHFDSNGQGTGAGAYGAAVYVSATNATRLIKKVQVFGNSVLGAALSDYGIYFGGSQVTKDVDCNENIVEMAGAGVPIYFATVQDFRFMRNTAKNGGAAGISVRAGYGLVEGNIAYDSQGSPTQTYGIEYTSSAAYVIFKDNILTGNVTGAFNALSTPDGARFVGNIEAADNKVYFAVKHSTANQPGIYHFDGVIRYQNKRTVTNTDHTCTGYDSYVAFTGLTAARNLILPSAAAVGVGHEIIVKDEGGNAATYNIYVTRTGSDTIEGANTKTINTNYGFYRLRSDGTSKWYLF